MSIPQPPAANGRLVVESGAPDGRPCIVVSLIGEFDMSNADRLRERLSATLDDATSVTIILDLSALDFIDSTILGLLVAADRRARRAGAVLRLAAPPPFVRRLLSLTALDTLFEIFSDVQAARSA